MTDSIDEDWGQPSAEKPPAPVWDHDRAQGVIRRFVIDQLEDQPLRVGALDESGQEKHGEATAGVKRQYMGCAGRVANGVNTVYCSYATPGGHALVGARIYVPEVQLTDAGRRAALGVPAGVEFTTKPQLAQDILAEMIVDSTIPPWIAGDEVYGRSGKLRTFLEDNGIGYVMRVGCAFQPAIGDHLLDAGVDPAIDRFAIPVQTEPGGAVPQPNARG